MILYFYLILKKNGFEMSIITTEPLCRTSFMLFWSFKKHYRKIYTWKFSPTVKKFYSIWGRYICNKKYFHKSLTL